MDTITELKPLRITFQNGTTRIYFHDPSTDQVYFLQQGHTRVSMYGTYRTLNLTRDDLLPQGTLTSLQNVLSQQSL